MIKVDNGEVHLEGSLPTLLTELTCILRAFRDSDNITEEMIEKSIELSKMTEEELLEKTKNTVMQKLLELKMFLDDKEGDK